MPDTDLREIAQEFATDPAWSHATKLRKLASAYLDLTAPVDAKLPKYLGDTHDCFCKKSLHDSWKFCPNCGRPIRWKT